MIIPDKLKIGGLVYDVIIDEDTSLKGRDFGNFSASTQKILIIKRLVSH